MDPVNESQLLEALTSSLVVLVRFAIGAGTLLILGVIFRRAILRFIGEKGRGSAHRGRALAVTVGIALILLLIRESVNRILVVLGERMSNSLPLRGMISWEAAPAAYFSLTITVIVVLLVLQLIGIAFWAFDDRIGKKLAIDLGDEPHTGRSIHLHVFRGLNVLNRAFRVVSVTIVLIIFLPVAFRFFPRTALAVDALLDYFGAPIRDIAQAVVAYVPNLAYLAVITALAWVVIRILRYLSDTLTDGTLVIPGFEPEWADPTYKLTRALFLGFVLMVSFPYLPGANSQFFQGFSLFLGALFTLGSSGAISNIVAGVVLTYTSSFRPGDLVEIEGSTGIVVGKSLLVTRLRTPRNEEITIPNGRVMTGTIQNFSAKAAERRLVLTVSAGIGYDVDWRRVHELLIGAAQKTERVLDDPPPRVLQTALGDFAVNYELRAWTDHPEQMIGVTSDLRRNVLDAFNSAGVEIMTPNVHALRDASGLAVPLERFPERNRPSGIKVELGDSNATQSSPPKATT
jgi:small-conductance mechanosensitive channel